MNTIKSVGKRFAKLSLKMKIVIAVIVVVIGWYGYSHFFAKSTNAVEYQTEKVEKGTLIVAVTASGQVSSTNNASATTNASGVVKEILVQNGQQVTQGDTIATIDLDQIAQQKYSQSLASYQSAQNSVASAQATQDSLRSAMFTKWDTFFQLSTNSTFQNSDGSPNYNNRALAEFHIAQDDWLAAEANYKNQEKVINQGKTALNSAWLTLQQSSPTIYAPISGTITGLSLQPGSVLSTQTSSTDSTTNSSTKVASVTTNANPTITINLTEIDVTKVKVGNKATVTLDAFADKTYTGKVISIDTIGSVTSGVTSYPTVIALDSENTDILPNMSASASIITETKDDVILVPTSAVQTTNGESTVQVMKNGQPQPVTVETGSSSDTQIEITSGISEGDTIVTSSTAATSTTNGTSTQSPFSPLGGSNRGFGGGNAVRISR